MFLVTKFGWTANISKPNKIGSWKLSSSGRSESYTRWGSKLISSNYRRSGGFMMFFTCHCWSRTPPGRGGWTRMWRNSRPAALTRSTRWKGFGTVRSMRRSQQQVTYRASTTWYHGRVTLRKRTPGSLHRQCNTSGSWSAPSTRIIPTSRQQPPFESILHLPWLNLQYFALAVSLPRLSNESAVDQRPLALQTRRQKYSSLYRLQISFPLHCPLSQEVFYWSQSVNFSLCSLSFVSRVFSSINLSVFFLSSHWFRRFFINFKGWFFLLIFFLQEGGFFNRLPLILIYLPKVSYHYTLSGAWV